MTSRRIRESLTLLRVLATGTPRSAARAALRRDRRRAQKDRLGIDGGPFEIRPITNPVVQEGARRLAEIYGYGPDVLAPGLGQSPDVRRQQLRDERFQNDQPQLIFIKHLRRLARVVRRRKAGR